MEIGKQKCFLCDSSALLWPNMGAYRDLECYNCGRYHISEQAIIVEAYKKNSRYIVAGHVFDNYYYNKNITMIMEKDFENLSDVKTIEKLYKLAKYVYYETAKYDQEIRVFNACCYAKDDEERNSLLEELKKESILNFEKKEDNSIGYEKPIFEYNNIRLTVNAKIKFENSIDSSDHFMEVLMNSNNGGGNNYFNYFSNSPGAQANQNSSNNTNTSCTSIVNSVGSNINEASIIEKLKENDVSQALIEQIKPEIKEIVSEYNKPTQDKEILKSIFKRIKKLGGFFLLGLFQKILTKPEIVEIIEILING